MYFIIVNETAYIKVQHKYLSCMIKALTGQGKGENMTSNYSSDMTLAEFMLLCILYSSRQ